MYLDFAMHDEEAAIVSIESFIGSSRAFCPRCGEEKRLGKISGSNPRPGNWKCYQCRRPFSIRSCTAFKNSNFPMHVFLQVAYLTCCYNRALEVAYGSNALSLTPRGFQQVVGRICEIDKMRASVRGPPSPIAFEVQWPDDQTLARMCVYHSTCFRRFHALVTQPQYSLDNDAFFWLLKRLIVPADAERSL